MTSVKEVAFKHEGEEDDGTPFGPVWLILDDGTYKNYKDGQKAWDGEFYPEWFSLTQAREIAKDHSVPLKEG